MRAHARENLLCGLMFVGFGLAFGYMALDYGLGTLAAIGPGLFPICLAFVLVALGVAIMLQDAVVHHDEDGETHPVAWRAVVLLLTGVLIFALTIRSWGLVPATFIAACLGALSTPRNRILVAVGLAALLAAMAAGIFVYGLGMPVSLFGNLLGG